MHLHADMRLKIIKILYAANMHWNHKICNDMQWKIFKNGLNIVKNLLQEINNSRIFSQIQLINQNFGKYFAKNVKILQKFSWRTKILENFFKKGKNFEKYINKNFKICKKTCKCMINLQKLQNSIKYVYAKYALIR